MNSKYGIGIKIYEAKGIYKYNLGVCMDYYTKKSFIKNSLLLDFLKNNGLKVTGNHTNDIIHGEHRTSKDNFSVFIHKKHKMCKKYC